MIKSFISMLKNDDGASLVEYALIIALVAGLAVTALNALGGGISNAASTMNTTIGTATGKIQTD